MFLNDVPLGIILKKLKIINFSLSLVSKSSQTNNNMKKQRNYSGIKIFFFLFCLRPTPRSTPSTKHKPFILTVRFELALLLERSFSPSHLLPLYTLLYYYSTYEHMKSWSGVETHFMAMLSAVLWLCFFLLWLVLSLI